MHGVFMFKGGGTEVLFGDWVEGGRAKKHADTKNASKRTYFCYWRGGGGLGCWREVGWVGRVRRLQGEAAQHKNMPTPGMFSSWSAGEATEHEKRACGHILHVRRQGQEGPPVRHPNTKMCPWGRVFVLGFKGGVGHLNTKIVPMRAQFLPVS